MHRWSLLPGLWIDRLIEINPEHTGHKRQHGCKGQKQHNRPDCDLVQPQTGQRPQYNPKTKDDSQRQTVADVHGAEKISRLAIEVETTGRTAIVHLGETPVSARTENSARSASRTQLAEDARYRRWRRTRQAPIIVDGLLVDSQNESAATDIFRPPSLSPRARRPDDFPQHCHRQKSSDPYPSAANRTYAQFFVSLITSHADTRYPTPLYVAASYP